MCRSLYQLSAQSSALHAHLPLAHTPAHTCDPPPGISLVIAATKWDALAGRDAQEQRLVAGMLRALAHAAGAHLVVLGGLQPGGGGGAEGELKKGFISARSHIELQRWQSCWRVTPHQGMQLTSARKHGAHCCRRARRWRRLDCGCAPAGGCPRRLCAAGAPPRVWGAQQEEVRCGCELLLAAAWHMPVCTNCTLQTPVLSS